MPNDKCDTKNLCVFSDEKAGSNIRRMMGVFVVFLIVQTCLTIYLVFFQPAPKVDARFIGINDSILDLTARLARVEQENTVLFRMFRNESDQRGFIPDRTITYPVTPLPPAPAPIVKPPARRTGDPAPGDMLGDAPSN